MTARRICLLLAVVLLAVSEAFAQASPPAPAPDAELRMKFSRDGSIDVSGTVTRYWQVNHEDPAGLAKELKPYFPGADVDIQAKGTSQNILRIKAPSEKWPLIEKLLEVIDVPDPQVFVEAKIIEIRYDSNLEFGFEATYDRRKATEAAQPFFGAFTGVFNPESYLEAIGTGQDFQGGTFEFKTVNDRWVKKHGEYSYILRALQERGSAEILSQPSIIAVQGDTATINTGVEFPVQSAEIRGNQTIVTTKFQKTGITLEIRPTLVGREYVRMDIDAKDSQITELTPGPGGALNPVISTRSAKTKVSVRDGETIIIGGLLSTSKIESKSGLPILSDIPILGYLFSTTRTEEVKSELVFFITPRIIKRKEQTVILPPGERKRIGQ